MFKKNVSMLEGPILPNIISYTIPIILTSILQVLFNAADLVVVGRFCGSTSVAAVGATGSITTLIVNLFIGLSVGAGVAVAHGIGCDNKQAVYRTVHTSLLTALVSGFLLTIIGVLLSEQLLILMGTPDTILPLSTVYMRIYFGGIVFNMLYNFCASILRASGDTKGPLVYLTISGIINVILNVIFVTLFNMNVAGVALATSISQAVSAVLVINALMKKEDSCKLIIKEIKFYKDEFLRITKIGLPAGIQGSLFSISNVLIQSSVNSFGEVFMSGSSSAGNIEGFIYVTLNAFSQTSTNFVGQNMGARNFKRLKKIFWICLISVGVVGIISGLGVYLSGEKLLSIYITDSQEAIDYGMIRLAFICLPYFLCGLMDVTTGALRGLGTSVAPMLISVIGICGIRLVWISTIFQMSAYHTPQILFASYGISWIVTFTAQLITFLIIFKKITKKHSTLEW